MKDSNNNSICLHNLRIGDLCADCGEIVDDKTKLYNALHSTDDLKITETMAIQNDIRRIEELRKQNKLVLVLDLDQTVLHTTISKDYMEGVDNFVLDGLTYAVKIRPFFRRMLDLIHDKFEIHVYTMGTKRYAEKICRILDPDKIYFGDRIISRSVNNGQYVKTLNRLFCLHENVIILDDRADVWDYSSNLILVKPFIFWNTGDLNDPSQLRKK
ncbi:RNA polymerase II subunit A C-terminal domain phosphatase [Nosema granulosis]|uniref:protein-serine/threonine phosphatase n=1 Tax=Nosema granulosis TaxID=83296 RepID=A0A9P6H1G6_9MICR|nr:RNA polymerase II subunit A C-terminal domain phosphatase [Nosema granulosis]